VGNPIDTFSLFSEPEPAVPHAVAVPGPPVTNPFQAPDFGEAAEALAPDAPEPPTRRAGRDRTARATR
jgi:hypothetical protein